MYASSTFILTAIMALVRVAVATPPACLLGAIGVQSNPADLASLCGTLESQVVGNITEKCSGDASAAAMSAYSSTCLVSESVTISITSSSASSSSTGSASATTTGSGSASASATGTAKGTATNSVAAKTSSTGSSASATATSVKTGAANSNAPRFAFAALAVGFVAWAL